MTSVKKAADAIYKTLFHLSFNLRSLHTTNFESFLINEDDIEQALDTVQDLVDTYTNTDDLEFNKTAFKILSTVGSFLYYYYVKGTRYIDRWTYMYKYTLDCVSITNASIFFRERYTEGNELYLVMLEGPENDIFEYSITNIFSKDETKNYIGMMFCLCKQNEIIKVKQISDDEYTTFRYTPKQTLSTLKFTKENGKIVGVIDNSKWADSAWGL